MSLADCIRRAIAAGDLDRNRGEAAAELYDRIEAEARGASGPGEAARIARAETARVLRAAAAERARRAALQVEAARGMSQARAAAGAEPTFIVDLLEAPQGAPFSTVEGRRLAIRGRAQAHMAGILGRFSRNLVGRVRDVATLDDLVREVFGVRTRNAAASEMASAVTETFEWLRRRFNAAGGSIPKRADWGLPQSHDVLKVRQASFDEWRAFILPRLDPGRMIDDLTGRPFSPERLELALRHVHETIRSDGFDRLLPSGAGGGRMLANRRADHRFLVFRDPDAWLEYQRRFGGSDPFSAMIGHIDGMARDIALMEILGPNPTAGLRWLGQTIEKEAVAADVRTGQATTAMQDRARRAIARANGVYDQITGAANNPVDPKWARGLAGLRETLTSIQLGAAMLSAVSDLNTQMLAARMAGVPQAKLLGQMLRLFNPADAGERRLAGRLGLVLENGIRVGSAHARYVNDLMGPEWTSRLSEAVLRLSGLSWWSETLRHNFGMAFLGNLADVADRPFADLDPNLRATFERYGLGADAWEMIRATAPYEYEGHRFLRPEDIAAREDLAPALADRLATRLLEITQGETGFAVIQASKRGRALFIGQTRPGDFSGELMRSAAMYKSFAVTLGLTHLARGLSLGSVPRSAGYLGSFVIGMTLFGALAMQLKEIAKGRDPRPMDSPEFWGAALLQGGGLGIFGDFLFKDVNRFGRSLGETIAGPVAGFATDVARLAIGNPLELAAGEDTNAAAEAVAFLRRYTPGGSLWWARLGYERQVLDQIQAWADPGAARRFRSIERRFQREFDQGYWWAPGRSFPDRAPDLTNVAGAP